MAERKTIEEQLLLLQAELDYCKDESKVIQLKNLILCLQDLLALEQHEAGISRQARLIECDDMPVSVERAKGRKRLELELKDAYCYKCASPELKVIKIIKVECRKCGRKRMITTRLDESKR